MGALRPCETHHLCSRYQNPLVNLAASHVFNNLPCWLLSSLSSAGSIKGWSWNSLGASNVLAPGWIAYKAHKSQHPHVSKFETFKYTYFHPFSKPCYNIQQNLIGTCCNQHLLNDSVQTIPPGVRSVKWLVVVICFCTIHEVCRPFLEDRCIDRIVVPISREGRCRRIEASPRRNQSRSQKWFRKLQRREQRMRM